MLLVLSWIITPIFFGSSFLFAGILSKYSMPLEYMMFYRLMIAGITCSFIVIITKNRLLIRKSEILLSIIIAGSQLNIWLQCYGTKYLISGLVCCICLTQIFVAEFIQAIWEKRRMKKNVVISGLIGTAGIIMLCNQDLFGMEIANLKKTISGIVISIISTFFAALCNLIYEKSNDEYKKMPKTTFVMYNCLFGALMLLLVGFIKNPVKEVFNPALFDIKYVSVLIYLSLTATLAGLFGLYYIISKQGAVKATYLNFIMPIISMILSTLIEGFSWNVMAVVGMLTLLFSVWVGVRK